MRVFVKMLTAALLIGASSLSSCSSSRPADTQGLQQIPTGTVAGVGILPGPLTPQTEVEPVTVETLSAPIDISVPISVEQQVGASAAGNRLLMIGDSITASISHRYGNEACTALVPRGWQVEVDAETGRAIDFGLQVLGKRLDAGWDAAVIFLGNNYDSANRSGFQTTLHKILEKLAPRPVALLTTMLFRSKQTEVNDIIRAEAALFPNVVLVEWANVTEPSFTGIDNLHLTPEGRAALGLTLAAAIGDAPPGEGKCLPTSYRDDSAGSPSGPAGNTSGSTKPKTQTTVSPNTGTATTLATRITTPTATTLPRNGPSTTVNAPQPTSPQVTSPQVTTPPQTSPPVTNPPQTSPPQTNPPGTNPPPGTGP
jgi:hypothetical protein